MMAAQLFEEYKAGTIGLKKKKKKKEKKTDLLFT
jgi:hypothetical protein